jgi:beta-fructofuranosidase
VSRPGAGRPAVHFTADAGWVNDPYGVVWHDDRYHLFYQYVPGSPRWQPECEWGHATSPDLVHWVEHEPALVPAAEETGCWSGTSVVTDGELQLFYTRVREGRLGLGEVVRARPDESGQTWRADPAEALIAPPSDLPVAHFRDPYVVRDRDRWVMVVGVGLRSGEAGVLQYTSEDLVAWERTGLLCTRPAAETKPLWTGSMWECPQFFPLGDTWVLLVSVWHADVLHHVVAATGEYDGERFTPREWQTLTDGGSAYAMTAFVDRDGRRCVMAWLREGLAFDPESAVRAGAQSLPYVVSLTGDRRLALSLHPDVERLRRRPISLGETMRAGAFDVRVGSAGPDGHLRLTGDDAVLDLQAEGVRSVVVDEDIVEVSSGELLTVVRFRGPVRLEVGGTVDGVECWELARREPSPLSSDS